MGMNIWFVSSTKCYMGSTNSYQSLVSPWRLILDMNDQKMDAIIYKKMNTLYKY
jgi:hypothetical protein